jgi:D-alanyl-D-alanine carboxypeptidase
MHSRRSLMLISIIALVAASMAAAGAAQHQAHGSVLAPTTPTALAIGRDAKLRRLLKAMVAQTHAPGGVLLVQTATGTWRRGVGAAQLAHSVGGPSGARRLPMRVTSRFRIASVTKTFTAALVVRLVADGALSLDDSVEQWLPGRLPNRAGLQITIRDLLRHTSGLQNAGASDGPMVVAGAAGRFYYANANYGLLGEIVTAVTGLTYGDALSARILRPLALADTEVATYAQVPAGLARGYSPKRVSRDVPRLDFTTLPDAQPFAAARLVSDADDVARFGRALFNGAVVTSELVAVVRTPGPVEGYDTHGYNAYGLGLMRFPAPCGAAWGHRGRLSGYTSYLLSTADGKRTVVVLLNVDTQDWSLVLKLNKLVTQALCT